MKKRKFDSNDLRDGYEIATMIFNTICDVLDKMDEKRALKEVKDVKKSK